MKILIISNLCPPDYDGGFELSAMRNAKSLAVLGHHVDFVTTGYRDTFQGIREDRDWVFRILRLSHARDGWSTAQSLMGGKSDLNFKVSQALSEVKLRLTNLRSVTETLNVATENEKALERFLETHDYDVAYVFGLHFIGTSLIRALMRKSIPVVYHHGDEWLASYLRPKLLKKVVLNMVAPRVYRREKSIDLKHVYLVSEFMKRVFLGAGFKENQLGVIYRGFDGLVREDIDRERFGVPVFLVASRLTLYKGIQIVIQAAKMLQQLSPESPWEVWIAGSGTPDAMEMFRAMVDEEGMGTRIRFLGKLPQSSVVDMMTRSTAFISPSVFDEPFGNTNIEALASGTPLIASRSGAIEEIISHGQSGLIYDRSNPAELAHNMQLLLENAELRRSLALGGIERVKEKFTQEKVIGEVEDLLHQVAGLETPVRTKVRTAATLQ